MRNWILEWAKKMDVSCKFVTSRFTLVFVGMVASAHGYWTRGDACISMSKVPSERSAEPDLSVPRRDIKRKESSSKWIALIEVIAAEARNKPTSDWLARGSRVRMRFYICRVTGRQSDLHFRRWGAGVMQATSGTGARLKRRIRGRTVKQEAERNGRENGRNRSRGMRSWTEARRKGNGR